MLYLTSFLLSLLDFLPLFLPSCHLSILLLFLHLPFLLFVLYPSVFAMGDRRSARCSRTTNFLRYLLVADTHRHEATHRVVQTHTHSQLITGPVRHNSTDPSLPSPTTNTHKYKSTGIAKPSSSPQASHSSNNSRLY